MPSRYLMPVCRQCIELLTVTVKMALGSERQLERAVDSCSPLLAAFGSGAAEGAPARAEADEEAGAGDEEEECAAEFKPVVQLDEVETQVRTTKRLVFLSPVPTLLHPVRSST